MPLNTPEVRAWLALATADMRMARLAAAADPPMPRQVCFHSHQAGEKCLKAVLEALELPVPRTHDLLALLDAIEPRCPTLGAVAREAAALSG